MDFQSDILRKYSKQFNAIEKKLRRFQPGVKVVFDKGPLNWHTIELITIVLPCKDLILYFIEQGYIVNSLMKCPSCKCSGKIVLVNSKASIDECTYKCNNKINGRRAKKYCHTKISVRSKTWFYDSKMYVSELFKFCYLYWHNYKQSDIIRELGISNKTSVKYGKFCRKIAIDLATIDPSREKIGGPGKEVEIDESVMEKRKYKRGRLVKEQWVFGGVERGTNKCFLVKVPNRTRSTLIEIVKKYILPQTTIISDCWRAYDTLPDHCDYKHLKVNHSKNFKDPETGEHTNTIEGLWHLVKLFLPSTNRSPKYLMGYLALYMLHRKWKSNDGFSLFMKEAAKLSAGIYDVDDKESKNNDPDIDSSFDSDSEKTADESSESNGGNYSESEIDKVDSDSAAEEKDLSTSSNSKAESDSEFEKKSVDTSDSEVTQHKEDTSDSDI